MCVRVNLRVHVCALGGGGVNVHVCVCARVCLGMCACVSRTGLSADAASLVSAWSWSGCVPGPQISLLLLPAPDMRAVAARMLLCLAILLCLRLWSSRVSGAVLGQVILLGAGMDTRAWRLSLPAGVQWWEVDVTEVLRAKRVIMERAGASFSVAAEHPRIAGALQLQCSSYTSAHARTRLTHVLQHVHGAACLGCVACCSAC